MFLIGKVLICILFKSLKSVLNMTVPFFFGIMNHGESHSDKVSPILRNTRYSNLDTLLYTV